MITIAANLAAKKGILVVVAAGNSGAQSGEAKYISVPADADSVFTIGSVDINRNIASSSSWGPNSAGLLKPNVVSVGANAVIANSSNGNPATGSGTSFACPLMAGLVACLWEAYPELTNMQIMDLIQQSADKHASPDFRFGHGIPDFKKVVVQQTKQNATASTSLNNCIVSINWISRDDTSTVYTIQKKIAGDAGYVDIGKVTSSSVSFKNNNYSFYDTIKVAVSGAVQYRIMQNIRTADTTFEIASLQQAITEVCFPENTLMALPSPFDQQLTVVVNLPEAIGNLGIKITDMLGRVMYAQKADKPAGIYRVPVSTGSWRPGIYEVTVYDGSKKVYKRKVLKK
jgi:serine protease AprX